MFAQISNFLQLPKRVFMQVVVMTELYGAQRGVKELYLTFVVFIKAFI